MGPEDFALQRLPQGLSHILIEIPQRGLKFDPRSYLENRGVSVESQIVHVDDNDRQWLIVSVLMEDIRKLILELIEKGLSGNIRGINLKTAPEAVTRHHRDR
ncbi:hypothetical protein [Desulfomonile tiedjei]|uniref:Uncharacterized protein n=1 Tax=Desulfomonile tiedjei (strain ATCC 49306 / DSM 6799 / DCB-1) TaxID=706587 RepID=I4C5I6_DESTA|nr:hypothetical protein [Desulfomonile tiedjei]AFM24827.1 hypothetical protein Desti_2128 [Desulfomonile tiedjei DSM 6799]